MDVREALAARHRLRKVLIATAVFFVVFTVAGFLLVPPLLKSYLTKELSTALHRDVTIGEISCNPYVLSLNVKDLTISDRDKGKTFFSFRNLYVNLQSISLVKWGIVIRDLRLDGLYAKIVRNDDGSYNFSDLLVKEKGRASKEPEPPRFSVNNIQVLDGAVDFHDGPKGASHELRSVSLTVPFLSNLPYHVDTYVQPSLEATLNGDTVFFKGRTKPFKDSLETSFDVKVSDLDIAHYLAYLPFKTEAKIVSAFFDAQTVVSYTQYSDRKPTLGVTGTVGMKTVKIDDKEGTSLIAFPRLSAEITSSDLMSATFNLSKLALESPEVNISRDKRGDVNVKELVPEEIADELVQLFRKIREILTFAADEIAVTGAVVRLSDAYPSGGFQSTLSDVDLRIDHFSNSPDELSELTFFMKTEAGESLSASAEFSVDPLIVEANVELAGLKLKKYEPYYQDLLRTKLENGVLGVTTALRFARISDSLEMRITGLSAKLESLHLRSREEGGDLVRLPEVLVKEGDIDIIKQDVRIGEVSSRGGTVSATRASDGSVDLLNLIEYRVAQLEGSAGEAVPEEARKPWLVSVGKLSVDGYTIRAEDRVPEDPAVFLAEKVKVRGENISTARNSTGKISLSLVPNRRGLISLAGSLSIDPMTLNLTTDAKEVLIGPFQPYIDTFVRIIVTEGSVSAKGRLRASYSEDKGIFVDYKGEALISSFGSVDRENAEDLLKWQVLHLGGLSIISSPPAVTVTEAALNGFSGHLVMNEDRTLNVMNLMAGDKSGDAQPAEPPPQTAGSVQQRLIRIDT
ncbi:MAG TPA: DUF748 domain-containing protein, partial [Dissulfurispiraceae bacterium]|nr:DUF748 domain-containing protein [Dissulfurispiraceae bacterium]